MRSRTAENPLLKIAYLAIKWFVGVLFIFSGLIKINDPVGTQIKLEEYFDVFAIDFHPLFSIFIPYALGLAIFLCVIEVVLGVALLVEFKMKWTVWILVFIIIFFTILTGYSAITNKVTDCGCFGDAIKLTPWQSFYKDIVLTILIGLLVVLKNYWDTKSQFIKSGVVILSIIFSSVIAYWAIAYLPPIDFRAYKIGANIKKDMQPSAPIIYEYIMEKDGVQKTFNQYPIDKSWKYVAINQTNPEVNPKITDYEIWNDEGSLTDSLFSGTYMFLIIKKAEKLKAFDFTKILNVKNESTQNGVKWVLLCSDGREKIDTLMANKNLKMDLAFADATVSKAIIRSNPGLWLLKDGVVKGKWHYNATPDKMEILDALEQ